MLCRLERQARSGRLRQHTGTEDVQDMIWAESVAAALDDALITLALAVGVCEGDVWETSMWGYRPGTQVTRHARWPDRAVGS